MRRFLLRLRCWVFGMGHQWSEWWLVYGKKQPKGSQRECRWCGKREERGMTFSDIERWVQRGTERTIAVVKEAVSKLPEKPLYYTSSNGTVRCAKEVVPWGSKDREWPSAHQCCMVEGHDEKWGHHSGWHGGSGSQQYAIIWYGEALNGK